MGVPFHKYVGCLYHDRRGARNGESLLLDLYPNAAAAYSVSRQLDPDQVAAMDVRESGGDTEETIDYSGGVLDEAALLSHCGSNDGLVTKLHDHSGNEIDMSQSTAGSQPRIVDAGTIEKINGKPAIRTNVSGVAKWLESADVSVATQPNTIFVVAESISSASDQTVISGVGLTQMLRIASDNFEIWSGSGLSGSAQDQDPHIWDGLFNGASSNFFIDGSEDASGDAGTRDLDSGFAIGIRADNESAEWRGLVSEAVVYDSDLGEDRSGVRNNMNEHFSIS